MPKIFECEYCGKWLSTKNGLKSHVGQKHFNQNCKHISISLPSAIIEKLKTQSEIFGIPISHLVLRALEQYLP